MAPDARIGVTDVDVGVVAGPVAIARLDGLGDRVRGVGADQREDTPAETGPDEPRAVDAVEVASDGDHRLEFRDAHFVVVA